MCTDEQKDRKPESINQGLKFLFFPRRKVPLPIFVRGKGSRNFLKGKKKNTKPIFILCNFNSLYAYTQTGQNIIERI